MVLFSMVFLSIMMRIVRIMCDWTHEEIKEKETVSAKAKAKDIESFEKKEERPLTTIS
jgi:Na+-transporting methylmalonyl-CoA/oxaloacetate decarboxylase gamma subunit